MESADCSAKNKAVSVVPLEVEVQAIQLKDIQKVLAFPRICYRIANQTEGDIFKKATGYYKNLQENKKTLGDCCETLMSTIAIHLAVDGKPKYIYKMSNVDASYEEYEGFHFKAKNLIDEIEINSQDQDEQLKQLFEGVSQTKQTFGKILLTATEAERVEKKRKREEKKQEREEKAREREEKEREEDIKKRKKETCEELCW